MGKEMEREKNIIVVNYYLKENIKMEKEIDKDKNIIIMVN